MQNLPNQVENCQHGEADPPGALAAKVERLRASLKDELPDLVREAVREEMQSARKAPDGGPLLSKEDVADWLGVSPRTVDTLAASGELRKIYVGGSVRFSPGAVEAYIRQRAGEGAA